MPILRRSGPSTADLQAWVDKLGDMTPTEIRKLMWGEKITGHTSAVGCPIAQFLKKKIGKAVLVEKVKVAFWEGGANYTHIQLPENVQRFISNFDNYQYRELEDDTQRGYREQTWK